MKPIIKIFIFCFIFLHAAFCFSQNKVLSKIDHYKELNGTTIHDILPDSKGNIWIATMGGLVKLDGYEFIWYHSDPQDNRTIGDLLTYSLHEDAKGRIWISSMANVYCYYPNTKTFKTYNLTSFYQESDQPMPFHIAEDNKGRIYFGVASGIGVTFNNALLYYEEDIDQLKEFEKQAGQEIHNIGLLKSDSKGKLIIGAQNGLFYLDSNRELTKQSDDFSNIFDDGEQPNGLVIAPDDSYWFTSTNSKLYRKNGGSLKSWSLEEVFGEPVTPTNSTPLVFDKNNNLLLAGSQGLITFNTKNEKFTVKKFKEENNFNHLNIGTIKYDLFGNLWLASQTEGLFKISNNNLLNSYTHDPKDVVSSNFDGWADRLIEDTDGIIWVPYNNKQLFHRINPKTGLLTKIFYNDILPDFQFAVMINKIESEKIFFNSDKGFHVYNLSTKSVNNSGIISNLDSVPVVRDIKMDSKNNLWICTVFGLFREKDGKSKHFTFSEYLPEKSDNNNVTLVLESIRNGVWAISIHGLYFIHNDTDIVERHGYDKTKGDVFTSQDINSLYEDKEGILWVGTWQGGLNKYNPETKKIKAYSLDDGLPSMSIQGILGDENNNMLWLSTFNGLSRFDLKKELFINYSTVDGAQGRLFSDGSYLKTSQGLFVFGGSNGINMIDPNKFLENSIPPKLHITEIKADNEPINFKDSVNSSKKVIALPYHQNNISIDYLGIHYDNPNKNKFAYKLANYDKEWRNVGNQRAAYYYNLPPGNYNFQVKSANSNGIWSEIETADFIISPPWWKTWWAYSLYVLGFVFSIYLFDRFQKKRIVEKERKKSEEKELAQAKEIEKAYTNLKTTQSQLIHAEKMASLGSLTAGIAHEIQNPLNFVNNFSDVSIDLMNEMEEEIDNGNDREIKEISKDIKQNLSKINHHGQRASGIVKSMLMHSRGGNGKTEPANINALLKEYVNLAFHGMRASKTAINAKIELDLDETIGDIELNAEDFSRVILNLCKNAFDAMRDKNLNNINKDYLPSLKVSTKKVGKNKVKIVFEDNGPGVSDELKDQLFQPFFTTKKGTEGTGLGLSITHDIVKNHKGQIDIESKENEFTRFEIELPLTIKKIKS